MDFSTPNFNALIMQGYNTGREMKRQAGLDNALSTYAQNPDDPTSVAGIARYDPRTAIQIGNMQQDRQKQLQAEQQKKLAEGQKAVGQAALLISQQPEQARPQAWDQAIDQLVGMGWDGLAQYKGKYSPQSLQAVIAQSGLANEFISGQQPKYMAIPEGGTLVNTRDPSAVSQFGGQAPQPPQPPTSGGNFTDINGASQLLQSMGPQGFLQWQEQHGVPVVVNSPEEMAALPPGTRVRSPDGREGIKR